MEFPKENFSEWYQEVLESAELVDNRYPVKGMLVWRPNGFKIRKYVTDLLRELLEETGHQEVLFPTLIPETALNKEGEHIRGFGSEVYWITHGGETPLDVKLALRPTSETAMYPMFALWIRSHADLPLRVFQIVSVFRYETKHTRPLIRVREVSTFKEAHCALKTEEEAEKEMRIIDGVYKAFWDELGIPFVRVQRPSWDKFAGADKTIAYDTIMPTGRTLQIATSHRLSQKFSEVFDVKYEDENGEQKLAYLTSHGISERAIAALVGIHGDNRGLVLPPRFAPVQVVIVPILYKGKENQVMEKAMEVYEKLKYNWRVELDDSDSNPGDKFYYWELRGVPIRIEIGPRDVENGVVTLARRDTKEKTQVKMEELEDKINRLAEEIHNNIAKRARDEFLSKVVTARSIDEIKDADNKPGIIKAPLCENWEECGKAVQDQINKEFRGIDLDDAPDGEKCVVCGKPAKYYGIWSNAY
uniref:Proline--tRNA ligase n=1 Tax=uncultured euryarchaeote Alv-FOS5 TaxID=337891 RepID=Q3SB96_9EURY|nr:prolyl-tRNA synthetase [uncultured euryarchaeote Alv-FOS5]